MNKTPIKSDNPVKTSSNIKYPGSRQSLIRLYMRINGTTVNGPVMHNIHKVKAC